MAMAPPDLAAPPPLSGEGVDVAEGSLRLAALVRDIRAEAQNLDQILGDVERIAALEAPDVRLAEAQAWVDATGSLAADDIRAIESRLEAVRDLFSIHPVLYDRAGDEVVHIENAWRRAAVERIQERPEAPDEVATLLSRARAGRDALATIVYHAALLTIPPRLNAHLRSLRPGAALDFHRNFIDELPDAEDRDRLLRYLGDHPLSIEGVVDPSSGLIYKTSASRLRRAWSFGGIVLLALLGGGLVFALTHIEPWFDRDDWPVAETRTSELLATYLLVFVGAFAHLLVDALKRSRRGASPAMALGDMLVWVHVREIQISIAVLSLWVGVVGLALSSDDIGWALAFFVGYSIDSVVDIFLARFETLVGERTTPAALNSALGSPTAPQ
jgi:hypothetical protein